MARALSLAAVLGTILVAFFLRTPARTTATVAAEPTVTAAPPPTPTLRPVQVETVPMENDLPAFVVRRGGAPVASPSAEMLFVPGACLHPVGYVQSFARSAAARGDLVTLQGDISCGGDGALRRWSNDLEAMDRRIEAAFVASGLGTPHDVIVIGYSQGAERVERLVQRWPLRYSRAVLIASPIVPSTVNLGRARGVVFMAGTFDAALGTMRGAVGTLRRSGVPSTFVLLPGARHGQMGTRPEVDMGEAFDFFSGVP